MKEHIRLWNFQLAADGARSAFLDFAMPRNRGDFAVGRVLPDRVVSTFARQKAAVRSQVVLQIEPFHQTASLSSSRTAPGTGCLRASSRW